MRKFYRPSTETLFSLQKFSVPMFCEFTLVVRGDKAPYPSLQNFEIIKSIFKKTN